MEYSDFGYWAFHHTTENPTDSGFDSVFAGGYDIKKVDMNKLAQDSAIPNAPVQYNGKAYATITDAWTTGPDNSHTAFVGTANLTFNPNSGAPTETLTTNFASSGWYNMTMTGTGDNRSLAFSGTPTNNAYKFATAPAISENVTIEYFGDKPHAVATEVVGIVNLGEAAMADGNDRYIEISFGAK
ncbi:hypothetical protein AGMMS50222_03880 [Endomicrobiia bacterium]|nr:hypothetical protein AGMMS50222_03880 [Endomicrobiia bacterium]